GAARRLCRRGIYPYGRTASNPRQRLMLRAVHSGLPVVRVGRGNTEGFVPLHDPSFIGGSNLTATKARLLLMACLMKFGSLPPAADPDHPTSAEAAAVGEKVAAYQAVFDTHSPVALNCRRLAATLSAGQSDRSKNGRFVMPLFVTQGRFTREYIKGGLAKPEDRHAAISRLCDQGGGKPEALYFT